MRYDVIKFERNDKPTRDLIRAALEEDFGLMTCEWAKDRNINPSLIKIKVRFEDPEKTGPFTARGTVVITAFGKEIVTYHFDINVMRRSLYEKFSNVIDFLTHESLRIPETKKEQEAIAWDVLYGDGDA